tara:strand:- start:91 stop:480 length:390 start_codon:yes stop_codon:yes gene_type:complete
MRNKILRLVRTWGIGGITGLGTGLAFKLVHDGLTTDNMFDLWELALSLITPLVIGMIIAKCSKYPKSNTIAIAYLTLLMPILGALFGSSGSEPLWQFAALGVIGGLAWSTPFALTAAISKTNSKESNGT